MSTFWHETIRFGSLEVPRMMAAPLDGVTDSPLRQLIRRFSKKELLFTEMRHIACVANSRVNTLFAYDECEQPLGYQISANTTKWIDESVEAIVAKKFVMLNLNMGCPARQVIKSGSGSALMDNLPLARTIIEALQKALKGRIPLTVKIRAGFKKTSALETGKMLSDLGVAGVMIHPRLQTGGFTAPLDYEITAALKKELSVPLVFSGNINNFARMKKVYERTGVDGFMIGRALWGAPWKMKEILSEADGVPFSITTAEMIALAKEHLKLNIALYGPKGVNPFKKQLPQYIRSVEGAGALRAQLLRLQTAEEMDQALQELAIAFSDKPC
jgi:tRNA-dihydrouridine synthase B